MRQQHLAGEKCFIDYCGPTVPVISPETGECWQWQQASVFTYPCIHCAVQIFPLASDPDVGFIHSPTIPCGAFILAKRFLQ
ncbi:hypothetical protein ACK3XA_28045 [Klebsiella grimontii]|uniref:hypothetical protein n=1 Tax=Enterobacteriaceae TaxID=543 RepID=UPI00026BB604|nr:MULTISPECIES: hypothetical protein [Enterobacteriaceae]HCB1450202.1 hypothetical protein [Citrobacter freundii]HDX8878024.1 hypothetical protein [Klebsiella oxytoca]HEE9935578.1 hypothetical protein [Citrobacter braakii]AFN30448.1 hypothetical protein A225_0581 [Klebsiella michiganensis E718]EHC2021771.1 hypothetical protein [Escherichia coli]